MRPPMLVLVLAFVNSVQAQTTVYLPTCELKSTRYPTPFEAPIATECLLEPRLLRIGGVDFMGARECFII